MLAQLLAIVLGLGSFILFTDAFLFPEVHRKGDFTWSGVGFLYALVLWVCAGQFTGGILLGQVAGVALVGWLEWQMLSLRWQGLPADYRARSSSLGAILVKAAAQVQRIGSTVVDRTPDSKSTKPKQPTLVDPSVEATDVTSVEAMDGVSDRPTIGTETSTAQPDQIMTEASTSDVEPQDNQAEALAEPSFNGQVVESVAAVDAETVAETATETMTELPAEPSARSEVEDDEEFDDSDDDSDDQIPAVVEVPAAEQPIAATTPMPKPAKPANILAQITNNIQQILINLGIKKKPRPTIVLDRSPKSDSEAEAAIADVDDSTTVATEDPSTIAPTDSVATDLEKAVNGIAESIDPMQTGADAETEIPASSEPPDAESTDEPKNDAQSGDSGADLGSPEVQSTETEPVEAAAIGENPDGSFHDSTVASETTVEVAPVDVAEIFPDETTDETVIIDLMDEEKDATSPTQQEAETASSESTATDSSTGDVDDQGPENTASSTS